MTTFPEFVRAGRALATPARSVPLLIVVSPRYTLTLLSATVPPPDRLTVKPPGPLITEDAPNTMGPAPAPSSVSRKPALVTVPLLVRTDADSLRQLWSAARMNRVVLKLTCPEEEADRMPMPPTPYSVMGIALALNVSWVEPIMSIRPTEVVYGVGGKAYGATLVNAAVSPVEGT